MLFYFLLPVCEIAVILYSIYTFSYFLIQYQIKFCFENSNKKFGSRHFQRVGRWRGNKHYFILGLRIVKVIFYQIFVNIFLHPHFVFLLMK